MPIGLPQPIRRDVVTAISASACAKVIVMTTQIAQHIKGPSRPGRLCPRRRDGDERLHPDEDGGS